MITKNGTIDLSDKISSLVIYDKNYSCIEDVMFIVVCPLSYVIETYVILTLWASKQKHFCCRGIIENLGAYTGN